MASLFIESGHNKKIIKVMQSSTSRVYKQPIKLSGETIAMRYASQFDTFNPLSDTALSLPDFHLHDIAARARSILSGWQSERIKNIATSIDAEIVNFANDSSDELVAAFVMQSNYFKENYEDYYNSRANILPKELVSILDGNLNLSQFHPKNIDEVYMLESLIKKRNGCLHLQWEEPERSKWHECKGYELFAVLSLWMVADSLEHAGKTVQDGYDIACDHARKALVAMFYAEKLRDIERKRELSDSRHTESRLAKELVLKKWEKNPSEYLSASKAGIEYVKWLKEQGHEYEPSTITGWIRKHAKAIGVKLR